MSLKKNVLLIIPELGKGGAERAISKLSILLSQNHQVWLCVFHTHHKAAYPYGGEIVDLHTPPTSSFIKKIYYIIVRFRAIRSVKKKYKIQFSISFLEGADYLNILTKYKDRIIISIRGSKLHDEEISGWLGIIRKKLLLPILYKRADQIVTVSKGLEYELAFELGLSQEKINTIPNFYQINEIQKLGGKNLTEDYEALYDIPVIINVGRLHPQKGQGALLKIFHQVRKNVVSRLLIIGEGSLKQNLITQATDLGLKVSDSVTCDKKADVYFLGYQSNPFQFISRAKVFAFPSYWEGFPNALLEAMICGTIVVSADCPTGPREILSPDTPINHTATCAEETPYGWLMPLPWEDEQEILEIWANIIQKCLMKEIQQKIETAQELVKIYSEENVSKHWLQLLE